MTIHVRAAKPGDAAQAVEVLRRSIVELCADHHRNDATTLEAWLGNKTEREFARWLRDVNRRIVVAELANGIRGVGAVHDEGEIRLLYVQPGFQGMGIGRCLLNALEAHARAWGLERVRLNSTFGARPFYERAGYRPTGPATPGFGVSLCYPFERVLQVGEDEPAT